MLPVTQIDTFYNGLPLRHRDTINAAAGETFMKRRPEECYDLIENMTAHHNDWDISAHRDESSSFTTSSSEIASLAQQMIEMRKDMIQMFRSNHQVNFVTPSYETCGGPHSYYECQAAGGYTQDIYATTGNYNPCGHAYQPQGDHNLLSYRANNFLGPPGPYTPTIVTTPAVPTIEDSPAVPEQTTVETVMNMTPENRAHFESEKEAIHLILIRIGDEIYSTVDACQTAQEMWEAIERLQQGESLNIQDVKTNLFWEFGQFTSHDGETIESYYTRFYKMMNEMIRNNLTVATMQVNVQFLQQLQPEWSRFVTIVKQQHKLDEVSYHKLFDILKQYQKEVNELRAERMAKNANPLALVATAQTLQDPYYQTSKPHKSYAPTSKASLPTRSHATTRYKGKEIAKPITPPSESASEEDSDPEQAQKDKDMQKNLALIAKYFKKLYKPTNNNLRTSSNTRNKNVDTTPSLGICVLVNYKEFGHFAKNAKAINVKTPVSQGKDVAVKTS
ncbi:hypothetical protein Tco_0941181 [Tanacetum coccineum]|uniref:Reverse transcriptase domain-containing protein n=1 Tax=Tanacetum coccineum TaxID=301880 RepID=A0ABQ5DQ51_9ASTR